MSRILPILFILPIMGYTWPIVKSGTEIIRILPSEMQQITAHIAVSADDIDKTYLKVQLNTGSNDVWLPAAGCDFAKRWCQEKGHFNFRESQTYKDAHREFTSVVKDAVISGFVGMDQIDIDEVVIKDMEFGQATGSNKDLSWGEWDGIVGLGPLKKSSVGVTFLQRLLQQGLDDAVFSFDLVSDQPTLRIGSLNHDIYQGDMVWSKINKEDKWGFETTGISLGGQALCENSCQIEFDTGVEFIVGPKAQVDMFNKIIEAKEIPGMTITTVDCSKLPSLPSLTFHLGDKTVSIPPERYTERQKMGGFEFCYLLITSYETIEVGAEEVWVMGTPAHKGLYVAYDFGRSQVGLAEI